MPPTNHSTQPDHCSAGAGSTGQSKQRAGSGPSHFTTSLTRSILEGGGDRPALSTLPDSGGKPAASHERIAARGWRFTSSCCRQKSARQSRRLWFSARMSCRRKASAATSAPSPASATADVGDRELSAAAQTRVEKKASKPSAGGTAAPAFPVVLFSGIFLFFSAALYLTIRYS